MTDKIPESVTNLFKPQLTIKERLQQIKDVPDFISKCAVRINLVGPRVFVTEIFDINIEGVEWTIICPADRSMYIAVTPDVGANSDSLITRQYVSDNEARDPLYFSDARWWFVPLDGYMPTHTYTSVEDYINYIEKLGKFYDLMFLFTCHNPQVDESSRVVLTYGSPTSTQSTGKIYNKRNDRYHLHEEESFKRVMPTTSKFDDQPLGYCWLEEPGKEKHMVKIVMEDPQDDIHSPQKVAFFMSNVIPNKRYLYTLDEDSKFTPI